MTDVLMPALSPTMEEGTLAKWHVKVGDAVRSGDVIAEIETDKATMEVEAVDEGVVEALLVPEGTEAVKVNAPIARLKADGEVAAASPPPAAPEQKKVEDKSVLPPRGAGGGEADGGAPPRQSSLRPVPPPHPPTASSPRRSPAASPNSEASTLRPSRAAVRTAA